MSASAPRAAGAASVSRTPGIVLGLGFGGFIDGIALHQIAGWHNMGSSLLPPVTMDAMRQNMTWDGYFHLATLLLSLVGTFLLLRDAQRGVPLPTAVAFTGQMLFGWGVFNLVEGMIDHHLLDLHHVRDLPVHVPLYDWLFLVAGGVGLIVTGWLMSRQGNHGEVTPR
ncbi:MAG: DUF2243 domain-containing protein [Gemmatimonadota bacterium]